MSPETFSHDVAGWLTALTSLVAPLLTFIGALFGILAYIKSHSNELRLNGQSTKIDNLQTSSLPATLFLTPPPLLAPPAPPVPQAAPPAPPTLPPDPPAAQVAQPSRVEPMPDDVKTAGPLASTVVASPPLATSPPQAADMNPAKAADMNPNKADILRAIQALVSPPPPVAPNAGQNAATANVAPPRATLATPPLPFVPTLPYVPFVPTLPFSSASVMPPQDGEKPDGPH